MHRFFIITLIAFIICTTSQAEDFRQWRNDQIKHAYFQSVTPKVKGVLKVAVIAKKSPAASAGLKPGDMLLSIDGKAVLTLEEMRYQRFSNDSPVLKIAISRGDKIIKLSLTGLLPVRRAGFRIKEDEYKFVTFLERMGLSYARNDRRILSLFPKRNGMLIMRILAGKKTAPPWLNKLLTNYLMLANQKANAPSTVTVTFPNAQLARLNKFYTAMIKRHSQGWQAPDWKKYEQDFDYYVFNYPLPTIRGDSEIHRYLIARSRQLHARSKRRGHEYLIAKYLRANPFVFAAALKCDEPLWEKYMDLDDEIGDKRGTAVELAKKLTNLSRLGFDNNDCARLQKLARKWKAAGVAFDAAQDLVYWNYRDSDETEKFPLWMEGMLKLFDPRYEIETYPQALNALNKIDWTNKEAALKECSQLYFKYGRPATILLIADYLEKNKLTKEANAYRTKVALFYRMLTERTRKWEKRGSMTCAWLLWQALSAFSSSEATSKWATEYGERYFVIERRARHADSAHLYICYAYLRLGDLPAAADHMVGAYAAVPDKAVLYIYGKTVSPNTLLFKDWLREKVLAHPKCTKQMKKDILEASQVRRR